MAVYRPGTVRSQLIGIEGHRQFIERATALGLPAEWLELCRAEGTSTGTFVLHVFDDFERRVGDTSSRSGSGLVTVWHGKGRRRRGVALLHERGRRNLRCRSKRCLDRIVVT